MFCYHSLIYEHPCCATVQEHFYYYTFILVICHLAALLPLWAMLPSLYTYTIFVYPWSPSTSYFPSHDISFLHIFCTAHMLLSLLSCTILTPVVVLFLVPSWCNAPPLSSLTLLLNSSSTLAMPLIAWPYILPLLFLSSLTFFPVLLPSQGVLVSLLTVPFVALSHVLPFLFSPTIGTPYIYALFPYT